jgi:hypothetical protein
MSLLRPHDVPHARSHARGHPELLAPLQDPAAVRAWIAEQALDELRAIEDELSRHGRVTIVTEDLRAVRLSALLAAAEEAGMVGDEP